MPIAKTKDNLKLSEYLQEKRKLLKIKLEELAQKTQIQSKYLKRIERGEWLGLPSAVYTKSFLKKYATAVGADEAEVVGRYEQELAELTKTVAGSGYKTGVWLKKVSAVSPVIWRAIGLKWNRVSEYAAKWREIGALAVVIIITGYIGWQLSLILVRPGLNLTYPQEDLTVSQSKIQIQGRADPASSLTVNGEVIYLKENGQFSKEVELLAGLNIFEIKAVSRFGKEKKIIRRVTYNP